MPICSTSSASRRSAPDLEVDQTTWDAAVAYVKHAARCVIVDAPAAWDEPADIDAGCAQRLISPGRRRATRTRRCTSRASRAADPLRDNRLDDFAPCGAVAGRLRAHRRAARRVEGARRHRRDARRACTELTVNAHRRRERPAQPARHQLPAHLPGVGQRRLGRAHAAGRRPARRRNGSTSRCAGSRSSSRRASIAARSGWCSSRTTSRCGRRSGSTSARSCRTCSARARSRARTPREAYFVKCDRETTTQNDINLGIVNILVGFAPLKPAEFVVIKIQQIAGQIADVARRAPMAQFSVNAQRFDPYKNFKFRVKWDGRYVAGVSARSAPSSARTEVVEHREGGDPSQPPQVAGPHQVRGDHARARRHPRHRVREVGEQGLELRLRARRGGRRSRTSARTSSSRSTTRPGSSRSPTRSSAAGSRSSRRCPTSTPTPTRSRSSTSSSRTRAGSATTKFPSRRRVPSPNRLTDRQLFSCPKR